MSEARLRLDRDKAEAEVVALRRQRDELVAEVSRLRALFDDAGQGEHNVLALVDHYQRESLEAADRLRATCRQRDELVAALKTRTRWHEYKCNSTATTLGDAVPLCSCGVDDARAVLAKWGAP